MLLSALGGADIIQIREKKAPARETYLFCRELQNACESHGLSPSLIVNDRIDIAMAANAQGVHLAQKSLPVDVTLQLRHTGHWDGIIGCSVHSFDEAIQAYESGIDYVTFGHIYASESHRGLPPRGIHELARIVSALPIPVVAIGGIDITNIQSVLSTGCSGVAVIGAILDQDDPKAATTKLKEQIMRSIVQPKVPFSRKREIGM